MPEWVEPLAKIAVTAAVVGVGLTAGIAESRGIQEAIIGGGILEAIFGGSDLIRRIRLGRRANFRRAMNEIKNDVEEQYRAWIEQDHHNKSWYQKANIDNAFVEIDLVIKDCVPTAGEVIDVGLNAEKLADLVLDKAARQNRAFMADSPNPAARDILRTIVIQAFERVRRHPEYASELRTYVDQAHLERASRIEDKVETVLRLVQAEKGVPVKVLRDIAIRFGISDTDLDPYHIQKQLRDKADEYVALKERLNRLTNDDPAVEALRREASELIEQGMFQAADDRLASSEKRALEAAREKEASGRRDRLSAAESRAQRGYIARLRLDFFKAAEHFEAAASMVPEGDEGTRWGFLLLQGASLHSKGQDFGGNQELHRAIEVYRTALDIADRNHAPLDRAKTQLQIGRALMVLGERKGQAPLLEQAIEAFREALVDYDRLETTKDWVETQNLLGNALSLLADHPGHAALLEDAAATYRVALVRLDNNRTCVEWATTMNNLGTALWRLGEREKGTERLITAINIYREAWAALPREQSPRDWAAAQSNLGTALSKLGERASQTEALQESIAAFREAMTVYTREDFPLAWATTQSNLGTTFYRLGSLEKNGKDFEEAVAAYRKALKERTREATPIPWALTQYNLGNALSFLGSTCDKADQLHEAISAYREALKEFTRESRLLDWADVQKGIATASFALSELNGSTALLREAVSGFRAAFKVHHRQAAPRDRAADLMILGRALFDLSIQQQAQRRLNLKAAIANFDEAIALFREINDMPRVSLAESFQNSARQMLATKGRH